MTAQHTPHTTSLWRRVLSLPQTRLGWWAVGLSGTFWVLTVTVDGTDWLSVFGTEEALSSSVLFWLFLSAWNLAGVAGTVVGLIASLRSHERSALVWLAMAAGLPAFIGAGWLVLVFASGASGLLGGVPTLWVLIALAGLIGVLIAWLQRHKAGKQR